MPSVMPAVQRRIPVLDGWRGVAILLVMANHSAESTRFQARLWSSLGPMGVDMFFVISGYIITTILLRERDRNGTISLSHFYLRRVVRLLPAAYTYLAVLVLLSLFLDLYSFTPGEVVSSLFFFRNYWGWAHPFLGLYSSHLWSLAVEEHFYIFWAALLLLVDSRKAAWIAAVLACACASSRLWAYHHTAPQLMRFVLSRTDMRADGLLIGCLLALALRSDQIRAFVYRNFPKETPILCGFPILLLEQWNLGNPSLSVHLLLATAIASTLIVEEGLAHRLLTSRPLVTIGTASYSLYLWQQIFLVRPNDVVRPFGWLNAFPWNFVALALVAAASYYLIERPVIEAGAEYLRRSSVTRQRLEQ